jgi:hypothetical protein
MNTSSRSLTFSLVMVALALLAISRPLAAQPSSDEVFEFSLSYGTTRNLLSLTEPFADGLRLVGYRDVRIERRPSRQRDIGVTTAAAVTRYLLVFSEFLYNDLGQSQITGRFASAGRASFSVRARLFEWTTGARVQFPCGTWRVRPYAGGGAGTVWMTIRGRGAGGDVVVSDSSTAYDLTYHFDAGVRVFATKRVGIAPEFRVVNMPDDRFYRVLVSAVFRFR